MFIEPIWIEPVEVVGMQITSGLVEVTLACEPMQYSLVCIKSDREYGNVCLLENINHAINLLYKVILDKHGSFIMMIFLLIVPVFL